MSPLETIYDYFQYVSPQLSDICRKSVVLDFRDNEIELDFAGETIILLSEDTLRLLKTDIAHLNKVGVSNISTDFDILISLSLLLFRLTRAVPFYSIVSCLLGITFSSWAEGAVAFLTKFQVTSEIDTSDDEGFSGVRASGLGYFQQRVVPGEAPVFRYTDLNYVSTDLEVQRDTGFFLCFLESLKRSKLREVPVFITLSSLLEEGLSSEEGDEEEGVPEELSDESIGSDLDALGDMEVPA